MERTVDTSTKEYDKIDAIFKKIQNAEDTKANQMLLGTKGLPKVKKFKCPDRYTFKTIFGNKNNKELYNDTFNANMTREKKENTRWQNHEQIKDNIEKKFNYYRPTNAAKSNNLKQLMSQSTQGPNTENKKVAEERLLRFGELQVHQMKDLLGEVIAKNKENAIEKKNFLGNIISSGLMESKISQKELEELSQLKQQLDSRSMVDTPRESRNASAQANLGKQNEEKPFSVTYLRKLMKFYGDVKAFT